MEKKIEVQLCKIVLLKILKEYNEQKIGQCTIDAKFIKWRLAQFLSFEIEVNIINSKSGVLMVKSNGEINSINWEINDTVTIEE